MATTDTAIDAMNPLVYFIECSHLVVLKTAGRGNFDRPPHPGRVRPDALGWSYLRVA